LAADKPDCSRALTLALHEHGLLYSAATGAGIDKDFADELVRRSGCKVTVTVMPRARIWQLIESGALDFSLSGITNEARDKFAAFAWYFSNKYYVLVRKDSKVQSLADFADNPQLQLGAIRGFRYSSTVNQFVDKLAEQRRVVYSSGLEPLYEVLTQGRIQGMVIEPFDYSQVASTQIRDITMVLETQDPSIPHGLIMSRKSLPAQEQDKWRALVDGMRADGTVRRIFEKYIKPDLASAMTTF
jgi:polar amino acid transport system substrate-binding protein